MDKKKLSHTILSCVITLATTVNVTMAADSLHKPVVPTSELQQKATSVRSRGSSNNDKLDAGLALLSRQATKSRSPVPESIARTKSLLLRSYGVRVTKDSKPTVEVGIQGTISDEELKNLGAVVRFRADGITYASVPISELTKLSNLKGVERIEGMNAREIPKSPKVSLTAQTKISKPRGQLADKFDHQGLTGKGVIVGVVDSGIDWRHPDFIKADGKSRILYLWDMNDDSYESSNGGIGSKAPYLYANGRSLGTVYTNEQINAALAGRGRVNSFDQFGHGTACAGTAAGNGNATANGVPKGTYAGVAPEADLIIVRAANPEVPNGIRSDAYLGVGWIVKKSKELSKPCAINLSYGGHLGAHDGRSAEERFLNNLAGPQKPGVAICVAAGNERSSSIHASGRFGPNKPGSERISNVVELNVIDVDGALIAVCLDSADDWGLTIRGDSKYLVDDQGNPIALTIWNSGTSTPHSVASVNGVEYKGSMHSAGYYSIGQVRQSIQYDKQNGLYIALPQGRYFINAWGNTDRVSNGRFDLYAFGLASFGIGSEHRFMIGAPGTAKNAITVGAYDFRSSWPNIDGTMSSSNLVVGELADYSNPGYSRDGTIKPDIVGPATYAISSMARNENSANVMMGSEGDTTKITSDGYHIAWSGTSASTPFVTGVIALMLQKNPTLDAEQIRKILAETATRDAATGGTPNRDWGYGKLNPVDSIKKTRPAASSMEASGR